MNIRSLVKILLLLLLMFSNVSAKTLGKESLIDSTIEVYKSPKAIDIKDLNNTMFEPYKKSINLGLTNKEVWVKLNLHNRVNRDLESLVVFNSANIDSIKVYKLSSGEYKLDENLTQPREIQGTLFPYFNLKLKPNESKKYFVNIKSSQTPSSFFITLEDKGNYFVKDRAVQFIDILIVGLLIAIVLYFASLYFYTKDMSHLLFSIFILIGLYYLFSYSGLSQVYASKSYVLLDKTLFVIKLNIMIILSALYSILFLKLDKKRFSYKLYIFIIAVSIIEILVASFYNFSYYFVLFILALYAVINVVAGVKSYFYGLKEAHLFTLGATILAIGIYLNIFNALSVDIVHLDSSKFMLIFLLSTVAFVLAFVYRYLATKKEEFEIFADNFDKKLIIDRKVREKKEELKQIENSEKILKENMNTIIKNNLQTVISMLKLQEPKVSNSEAVEELKSLESRLVSIVKTYSLFLSAKNPNFITMKDYLKRVIDDTILVYGKDSNLKVKLDVDAVLGLEDAIYIALSVVDFIINRLEDSESNELITILLKNEGNEYKFSIKDEDLLDDSSKKESKSWFKRVFKKSKS